MAILYRKCNPLETSFLRAAVGIRRAEVPQQHDIGDDIAAEVARIRKEFKAKDAVSAAAYLAIAHSPASTKTVGYAYGFERKTPRRKREAA